MSNKATEHTLAMISDKLSSLGVLVNLNLKTNIIKRASYPQQSTDGISDILFFLNKEL